MNDPMGCRDMELLCRQRATFDIQRSWKWLGEAERWKDLAHRETASRFHAEHAGPMAMGPNRTGLSSFFLIGRYDESWAWVQSAYRGYLNFNSTKRTEIVCLGALGRIDEAKIKFAKHSEIEPLLRSATGYRSITAFRRKEDIEKMIEHFRIAGMTE